MATLKFMNVDVEIEDPQNKFENDKEMTLHVTYNKTDKTFRSHFPEKKAVDTTPRPKPVTVYEDKEANVKGTITTHGRGKAGIDVDMYKLVRELGYERGRDSLLEAYEKVYEKCKEMVA